MDPAAENSSNTQLPSVQNQMSDYRLEAVRLASYQNWPLSFMDPAELAAAGLYFTGDGDKVKCFECQVEICQWVEGDNSTADHQRWSGRCRFIRQIPCGNVPIGVDPATIPPRCRDVCGPYGIEVRPEAEEDCHSSLLPSTAQLNSLGLKRTQAPAYPEYASRDARYKSFLYWPKSMQQTKAQMADAGFYYTGRSDQTLCYHCGGGLADWERGDDPWEQHARWLSKCHYLLMAKGQEYVNNITGQRVQPLTREETQNMELPSFIKKVEVSTVTSMETEQSAGSSEAVTNTRPSNASVSSSSEAKNLSSMGSSNNNKPKDDGRVCKICYSGELGVVFLPCGHMFACVDCASGMTACAVCRGLVIMTVRAFLS